MMFSRKYRSFTSWLKAGNRKTRYGKSIIAKHNILPNKTLSELSKLNFSDFLISNKKWIDLTKKEKRERNLVISAIRRIRNKETLNSVINNLGITKELIQKHLGKYLFKKNNRWAVLSKDYLQTSMMIYETDLGINHIIVTSSKDRSIIGEYFSNIKKALRSGDASYLEKYKKIRLKDASGKYHKLETDLNKVKDYENSIEEPEFLEIYRDR